MILKFKSITPEAEREALVKVSKQPRGLYIIKIGVLRFGLPMFVFMVLYKYFIMRDQNAFTLGELRTQIIIWMIAGCLYGFWAWSYQMRKLDNLNRNQ